MALHRAMLRIRLVEERLSRAGSVSVPHALEGPAGLVKAFARTECDVEALAALLGRDWLIARVTFKPYPVCAFIRTPVTAALAIRNQVAGEISSVRVTMNPCE